MVDYKSAPFNLNDSQISWVKDTLNSMTIDEKIGQIFCPSLSSFDPNLLGYYTNVLHIGSCMVRPFPLDGFQDNVRLLQSMSKIPMLISANLESGGSGAITEGTEFAPQMACAATKDKKNAYHLGKISASEAASVGINWGYAPVVDIDRNFHNPIVNVRAYSSDPNDVIDMAREYIKAAKEEGVAPTIKHFPGDGSDERDQHLLVSVNSLSSKEWFETYGKIYKTLIDEGAPSVMVGHIAQPSVAKELNPELSDAECYHPASISQTLMTKLLREKLGFNGLIVTDSTLMAGYMQKLPRRIAIPTSIQAGADVILFNRSLEEDIGYFKKGLEDGLVTMERIDEAVERMLALKASMGLIEKKADGTLVSSENPRNIVGKPEYKEWTRECADNSITLVKDVKGLIPLNKEKIKRIYLNVIEGEVINNSPFGLKVKSMLEEEGFDVTLRERKLVFNPLHLLSGEMTDEENKALNEIMSNTDSFVSQYDMAMIVVNVATMSNNTVVRINWQVVAGLGNDLPWYSGEMPLLVVSMSNPYHLFDIPMAHTYINTYSASDTYLKLTIDKIMGRSEFKGISPVDPFCGVEDTKY